MKNPANTNENHAIDRFKDFADKADYSYLNDLNADPDATVDGLDHNPRQVFSGHSTVWPRRRGVALLKGIQQTEC